MTYRNRVTPLGEIVAIPLRGAWTGNRGILHRDTEIVRMHAGDLWITCALTFRDWHTEQWRPGHFTWLYFHDEAVSFAAGHRPCALCRRPAYRSFRDSVARGLAVEQPSAQQLNRRLHAERIVRGTHRRRLHMLPWAELPDGVFVLVDGGPRLVRGDATIGWTHLGYGDAGPRPRRGDADVITPPSTVAAFRAGYEPQIAAPAHGQR